MIHGLTNLNISCTRHNKSPATQLFSILLPLTETMTLLPESYPRTPVYRVTQCATLLSLSLTLALHKLRLIVLVRMAIDNQSCMCGLKI